MKKALRETQTLRAGCSKVEPKNFAPPQTRFSGAQDSQNLISWRWSLPLPIHRVWWGSMHAISSYRGSRPTHTPTHPPTDRTEYNTLIHCAAASAQCKNALQMKLKLNLLRIFLHRIIFCFVLCYNYPRFYSILFAWKYIILVLY